MSLPPAQQPMERGVGSLPPLRLFPVFSPPPLEGDAQDAPPPHMSLLLGRMFPQSRCHATFSFPSWSPPGSSQGHSCPPFSSTSLKPTSIFSL